MRFYYQDVTRSPYLFQSGISVTKPATAHVISYIYLSNSVETNDAHIGYRYDYSAYGMIYQIAQFRGMSISYTGTDQTGPNPSGGTQAALTTYNYPTDPNFLSDAPSYTTRTDDWAGRISAQPVYNFSVDPTSGVSTVTAPDGTVTETTSLSGAWADGLISEIKIKVGTTVLSDTIYTWEQGPNLCQPAYQTGEDDQ